ncbi:LPS assembly lipoprotein LptE [Methylopila henanensis]|uniref:LPS assembly lipoprotein LptE n=1 Tax=Methylopila henanensis TaxID=873516 RepID=A0ABW4K6U7_9HYPH
MSSPDIEFRPARRTLIRAGLAAGLSLALAGCFRPVYAPESPSATGDAGPVAVNLKRVDVTPIEGRVGLKMRNELIFLLRGGDAAGPIAYRLDVALSQRGQSPIVDPFTGQPETRTVSLTADYILKPAGRLDPIIKGQEFATASYNYSLQRFADIRAQRDAEDRAAQQIAEKIRTRLQGYFATGR